MVIRADTGTVSDKKGHIAYKYRIYPDSDQAVFLAQSFGCVRFVYNFYLDVCIQCREYGFKHPSKTECNDDCNQKLKDAYPWLRVPDKFALTNAIFALDNAFSRFFSGQNNYPVFKKKGVSRDSYKTDYTNGNIEIGDNYIKLPKAGKVKAVIHRRPEYSRYNGLKLKSATVSREKDGSYYCSVLFAYDAGETVIPDIPLEECAGLDYKSDGLYVDHEGYMPGSPKFFRKMQKKLAREQRRLSRMEKDSSNYKKQKLRIARIHRAIANARQAFLRQAAAAIAKRFHLVCVEDLDMKAMSNKGFGLGKSTMDNGWGMFLKYLEEALAKRGGMLVKISRWYPSTQTCSHCGSRKIMQLDERTYVCPHCGKTIDRDWNSAINIREEGYRLYCEVRQAA